MRIAHVPLINYREHDGITRAAAAVAAATKDIADHVLIVNKMGDMGAPFTDLVVVPGADAAAYPRKAHTIVKAAQAMGAHKVHFHGGAFAVFAAAQVAAAGMPAVATIHTWPTMPASSWLSPTKLVQRHQSSFSLQLTAATSLMGAAAVRHLAGKLDGLFTPDPAVADRLWDVGGQLCRIALQDVPAGATWAENPTVFFAGKAEDVRGGSDLLTAWEHVAETVPQANLRMATLDGPAARRWERQAKAVPNVNFTCGYVPDLAGEMAASQLGVFAFRDIATLTPTMAALECAAAGIPVVATDVRCVAEAGNADLQVSAGNPEELARAIIDGLNRDLWAVRSKEAVTTAGQWVADETERQMLYDAYVS